MTFGSISALVILVSILVTLILAIGSYAAFKLRDTRKPTLSHPANPAPAFFKRYVHVRERGQRRDPDGDGVPG